MNTKRFAQYSWGVLAYNLLVILWGAFVRATGSGAGCGAHWPLCNGEVVPHTGRLATAIEFSHRLSSGLALILMVGLVVWAFRLYPRGHLVRRGASVSAFFLLTEALLGAGLVLFEYVAANVSVARAYWMAGHLINTFLLLAALTLTAWWASGGQAARWRNQGAVGWSFGLALFGLMILGADGGVTALGDTLVLTAGISPNESAIVAQLVALRIYHPLLAFTVGGLIAVAVWLARTQRPTAAGKRFSQWVIFCFVLQLILGGVNVAFKAPVGIQLLHLLISDLIWISFVLLTVTTLAQAKQPSMDTALPETESLLRGA